MVNLILQNYEFIHFPTRLRVDAYFLAQKKAGLINTYFILQTEKFPGKSRYLNHVTFEEVHVETWLIIMHEWHLTGFSNMGIPSPPNYLATPPLRKMSAMLRASFEIVCISKQINPMDFFSSSQIYKAS